MGRFIILFCIVSLLVLSAPLFAQEEEEEVQSEEEIWSIPKKAEKRGATKGRKAEEEETVSGSFEYIEEEGLSQKKKVKEEEKKEKEKEQRSLVEETGAEVLYDAGVIDAGAKSKEEKSSAGASTQSAQYQEITELKIPKARLREIEDLWLKRLEDIKKREFALAGEKLKRIVEEKIESGIPNIPYISLSLILEAKQALKARDYVTASRLAEAATIISPDIYEVWFFNAYLNWTTNKTDILKTLSFILKGIDKTIGPVTTGPLVLGNAILFISLIISITALMFIVLLLIKNAGRILHDLSHLFPSGRSIFLSSIIWISLFLTLIVKFLSVFHFFFICSIILWLYINRRERIILVVLVLLISALPYSFSIYNNMLNIFKGNDVFMYKALKFEDPDSIERLKGLIESGTAGSDEYVVYGLINKRRGEFELAEKMYKKAIELNASNVIAYNNLGNLYIIKERYDDALNLFNTALNLEPQSPVIRYNISRLFLRKKELDKSNAELEEAKRFNEELISELLKGSSSGINRFVCDMEPLYNLSLKRIFEVDKSLDGRMYLPFENYITAGIMKQDVILWLIIMGIAIIVVGFLSRYINVSHICHRCGRAVCKSCSPELHNDDECSQCFHIFTRRDVADPKSRFIKDREIASYQFIHSLTIKLLSFMIPGAVFISQNKPFKSIFVLLLSVAGLISLIFFNRPNPLPYFSTTGIALLFKGPFVLAGVIAYIVNIKKAFSKG